MYPASRIPVLTIASAISRTIASVTCPWNLFQLFQPIGGVLARPFDFTGSGIGSLTIAGRAGSGSGFSVETRDSSNTCGGRGGGGRSRRPPAPGRSARDRVRDPDRGRRMPASSASTSRFRA